MKRVIDVVGAAVALVVLSPLLAVVAVLVRLRMGSPVLFRQDRPGLGGRPFQLVKFRTMNDRRGPDGALLPDAERLTGLGRWLRRTSIDELPELLNVLRGDMSLVGPRPLLMEYLPLYTPEQARRHEVRPGVTGWAQVNGRNAVSWEDKFALDVWYVDHRSTKLDVEIVAKTVRQVVGGHGVSAPGHVTIEPFRGSPR
ncbi:MAG TPA: sugar transferase [Acidimicrobiia bacterium]